MTKIGTIASFLPQETYVLLIMLAGFAIMLGFKRVAATLGIVVACGIFLPVIIEPLLDMMPLWLLILVGIFTGIAMLRFISELTIGKTGTDHAVGILAADGVKAGLKALFWPIAWLLWLLRFIFRHLLRER
jgi:hypothetical protein